MKNAHKAFGASPCTRPKGLGFSVLSVACWKFVSGRSFRSGCYAEATGRNGSGCAVSETVEARRRVRNRRTPGDIATCDVSAPSSGALA